MFLADTLESIGGYLKQLSHITVNRSQEQLSRLISQAVFLLYVAVIFFGLVPPFQEATRNPEEIRTSNVINQVVYSSLYLMAFISLIPIREQVVRFVRNEKLYFIFIFWCLLTVLWSDYPGVAFKRSVHLFGTACIYLTALLHMTSSDEAFDFFKYVSMFYLTINFLAILLVPEATQWEFPAWRGISPHKNLLGQAALISLMVWTVRIHIARGKFSWSNLVFWTLSLTLLIGARSATCTLTACMMLLLLLFLAVERRVVRPQIGFFLSITFLGSLAIVAALFLFWQSGMIIEMLHLIGKQESLGRVELWSTVFAEAQKHLLLGSGYGAYWVMDSERILSLFKEFVWLPNEAHLGYLDILNETGLVGLFMVLAMVIRYFKNLKYVKKPHYWMWFVIAVLLINCTESTLFHPLLLTGAVFNIAYLALYAEIMRSSRRVVNGG